MTHKPKTIGQIELEKAGKIYHCSVCGFQDTAEVVKKHMREKHR